jgi:hypothetical protein
MFIQVIQGKVADPAATRAAFDTWVRDLAPGAEGWLGSTGGVTDDGTFITLARFASADAARRNSARPEQDQWWAETSQHFTGEVTFADSDDVVLELAGDPDAATFVQIMRGRINDPERAKALMSRGSQQRAEFRPDVLGTAVAMHEGGAYTMAVYFTSEADARAGETKEPPAELKAESEEMGALMAGPPEFYDLRDPWLFTSQ